MTQNIAVFLSPTCSSSNSSVAVNPAMLSRLKAARRTPTEIRIDFAVLPAACLYILYCFTARLSGFLNSSRSNNSSSGD